MIGPWGAESIEHYRGDVKATIDFGFDGVKYDGCGLFKNMPLFASLFNDTGNAIMLEECTHPLTQAKPSCWRNVHTL